MKIREIIKKIILGKRSSSKSYIEYLRDIGVEIGEDVTIYVPSKTLIDEQYPWMIAIGNHVRITEGVKILTHDYSWSVLKKYATENENAGEILGASGEVIIGDNVFIGMNSIITRNVTIGNNVSIGTGSVVTKDCKDDGVYVGVPAHRISSVSEYKEKRKREQLKEAKTLAVKYYEKFKKRPEKEIFNEYFMLFESEEPQNKNFKRQLALCDNYDESISYMKENKPLFNNYEDFLKYCIGEE